MGQAVVIEQASTLSREEFVARWDDLFLFVELPDATGPLPFHTVARFLDTSEFEPEDAPPEPGDVRVLILKKAEGNPYPNQLSVGRARNCDLVLRHETVSKLHAHFLLSEDGARTLRLVDRGSQNGTSVNGRALAMDAPLQVGIGDSLRFGAIRCTIVDSGRLYDLLAFG